MKKIELHLHLDGSLNISYAEKILGTDVSSQMIATGCHNLSEYLEKFNLPIQLLQEKKKITEFSYLLGKDLEKDGVIYAEVRFCPLLHVEKISADEVISAVLEGFQKISTVKVNLILCMMRNFPQEKNKMIIDLVEKHLGQGVCAIDLAGDEANYHTSSFAPLFEEIRKKKIPFTIHAGEADSFSSVDAAISFGALRIGHGIRSIESSSTIQKLIDYGITLEVCPTSNLDTKVVSNILDYPIKKLMNLGVLITINTDNRTVSNTSLEQEYQLLRENFGFEEKDFLQFNLNAIDVAFLSSSEKEELKRQLLK